MLIKYNHDEKQITDLEDFHEKSVITRQLLKSLGSFWEEYYPGLDDVIKANNGVVALGSSMYTEMLDMCLSSNILDIPEEKPISYKLFLFNERKFNAVKDVDGEVIYYSIYKKDFEDELSYYRIVTDNIDSIQYLTSSLLEPSVILERGTHFDIVDDELRLYVDLYGDTNIFDYLYRADQIYTRHVLLWGVNVVLKDEWIYERFGRYLYKRDYDSYEYKMLVTSLLYFFVSTKSAKNIESIINILFGAPFSHVQEEAVLGIEKYVEQTNAPVNFTGVKYYHKIKTTHSVYYSPSFFDVVVQPGQVLKDYQMLSKFPKADDYISDPNWYDGALFPINLIEGFNASSYEEGVAPKTTAIDAQAILDGDYDIYGNIFGDIPIYRFDGDFTYSDEITYKANIIGLNDWKQQQVDERGEILHTYRMSSDTVGIDRYFYDLVDQVLKYNLIYINVDLSFESYNYFRSIEQTYFDILRHGLPVYLYTILDTVLYVVDEDNEIRKNLECGDFFTNITHSGYFSDYYYKPYEIVHYAGNVKYNGDYYEGSLPVLKDTNLINTDQPLNSVYEGGVQWDYSNYGRYDGRFVHKYLEKLYNVIQNRIDQNLEDTLNYKDLFRSNIGREFTSDYYQYRSPWDIKYDHLGFYDGKYKYRVEPGNYNNTFVYDGEINYHKHFPLNDGLDVVGNTYSVDDYPKSTWYHNQLERYTGKFNYGGLGNNRDTYLDRLETKFASNVNIEESFTQKQYTEFSNKFPYELNEYNGELSYNLYRAYGANSLLNTTAKPFFNDKYGSSNWTYNHAGYYNGKYSFDGLIGKLIRYHRGYGYYSGDFLYREAEIFDEELPVRIESAFTDEVDIGDSFNIEIIEK